MHEATARRVLVFLMGIVLVCVAWTAYAMQRGSDFAEEIRADSRAIRSITEKQENRQMTTEWCYYIVEGVKAKHSITTSKMDSETNAEWAARHRGYVDAAKAEFVPVSCN